MLLRLSWGRVRRNFPAVPVSSHPFDTMSSANEIADAAYLVQLYVIKASHDDSF